MNFFKKVITYFKIKKYKKKFNFSFDKSSIFTSSFKIRGTKNGTVKVGKDTVLHSKIIFENPNAIVHIGDRSFINKQCKLITINNIDIGNDVMIAWGVTLMDHNAHSFDYQERQKDITNNKNQLLKNKKNEEKDWSVVKSAPIRICDNAWIGFDATILKGVTVGEGAIVGAKSVVREDVKPWTVVAGNPAIKVGEVRH